MTSHILTKIAQKSKLNYYEPKSPHRLIVKAIEIVSRVKYLTDNERMLRLCDEFDVIFDQYINKNKGI